MATKAEKVLKTQTMGANVGNAQLAAIRYVNAGLSGLGLKPSEKAAMKEKLIPIVAKRISLDRGRTASRAKNVVSRETKARLTNAQNKFN
jgi:hypothetical protein